MAKSNKKKEKHLPPTIKELYPGKSDEWYQEAEENFKEYGALAFRVYDRIQNNPEELKKLRELLKENKKRSLKKKKL